MNYRKLAKQFVKEVGFKEGESIEVILELYSKWLDEQEDRIGCANPECTEKHNSKPQLPEEIEWMYMNEGMSDNVDFNKALELKVKLNQIIRYLKSKE